MDVIDASLAKLAALGITVLVASGDHGSQDCAAGVPSAWCPSARDGSPLAAYSLWAAWPASSPWVAAVGDATFVRSAALSARSRRPCRVTAAVSLRAAASRVAPIARRSRSIATPWQLSAVEAYLNRSARLPDFPPAAVLAAHGRAVPDVSAFGAGLPTYQSSGQWVEFGGTSIGGGGVAVSEAPTAPS
eukprot:1795542-Prymnesium_polylepis.2